MIVEDSIQLGSFQEFIGMLQGMINHVAQPQIEVATWESVINVLQEMERGFFASSVGPDGQAWAPLKPYTVQKKGHAIILRETYELMAGLTGNSATSVRDMSQTSLEFGTSREWAWVHQNGAGRIPQRMMVGMTEESIDSVLNLVADAAVQMMFK